MPTIRGYAQLPGQERVLVYEYECDADEVAEAIDSGEIYGWIKQDGVDQVIVLSYGVE